MERMHGQKPHRGEVSKSWGQSRALSRLQATLGILHGQVLLVGPCSGAGGPHVLTPAGHGGEQPLGIMMHSQASAWEQIEGGLGGSG